MITIAAVAAATALASPGDASVFPWPIGRGPRFLPPARSATVMSAQPVGRFRCLSSGRFASLHIELFADRRVIVVPAGIGIAGPWKGCSYPARTRTPTGVVQVLVGSRLRMGDLFRIWGQPLGAHRIASFRSTLPVRAYVNGKRVPGDPRTIPLVPGAQIVLELGRYLTPHPSFLFPKEGGEA